MSNKKLNTQLLYKNDTHSIFSTHLQHTTQHTHTKFFFNKQMINSLGLIPKNNITDMFSIELLIILLQVLHHVMFGCKDYFN